MASIGNRILYHNLDYLEQGQYSTNQGESKSIDLATCNWIPPVYIVELKTSRETTEKEKQIEDTSGKT